jgi:hypothetical protein
MVTSDRVHIVYPLRPIDPFDCTWIACVSQSSDQVSKQSSVFKLFKLAI